MAKSPTTSATPSSAPSRPRSARPSAAARRAQGALDDLVDSVEDLRKGAEERLSRGRRSVADAIEGRRPATYDDIKELKAELRAIGRRLDSDRGAAADEARAGAEAPARARAKSASKRAS